MALRKIKIEETVSTNPGVLANGYEKSFSFLIENLTFMKAEALSPRHLVYTMFLRNSTYGKNDPDWKIGSSPGGTRNSTVNIPGWSS